MDASEDENAATAEATAPESRPLPRRRGCIDGGAAAGLRLGGGARTPDNTAEPSIVGNAIEGRTLTANQGTWSGTTPMSFAYRWLRCPTDGRRSPTAPTAPPSGDRPATVRRTGCGTPTWGSGSASV